MGVPCPLSVPRTCPFCETTPAAKSGSVMSSTADAVGYAVITLPTIPSGVTTAIPRSTPDTVPRSTNTTLEFVPAPIPMTVAATVLEGVCD